MQYGKVEICGINTSKLEVLPEKETLRLIDLAQKGDESARKMVIKGNLRLVLSAVQRFSARGENPDDLFQVGCIGLIKGIDNFDCSMEVKPSTYLFPMIIGEIRRFLRDNNSIRVSRSMRDTAYRAMQAKEALTTRLLREPTVEEIAKEMDSPITEVVLALEAIVEPVSIYEPVYSDGGDTIYICDQIGDYSDDSDWTDEIVLKAAIQSLSPREKKILGLRFMNGKTQTEVAEEIGISQAQVSRIEKNAMSKIHNEDYEN